MDDSGIVYFTGGLGIAWLSGWLLRRQAALTAQVRGDARRPGGAGGGDRAGAHRPRGARRRRPLADRRDAQPDRCPAGAGDRPGARRRGARPGRARRARQPRLDPPGDGPAARSGIDGAAAAADARGHPAPRRRLPRRRARGRADDRPRRRCSTRPSSSSSTASCRSRWRTCCSTHPAPPATVALARRPRRRRGRDHQRTGDPAARRRARDASASARKAWASGCAPSAARSTAGSSSAGGWLVSAWLPARSDDSAPDGRGTVGPPGSPWLIATTRRCGWSSSTISRSCGPGSRSSSRRSPASTWRRRRATASSDSWPSPITAPTSC